MRETERQRDRQTDRPRERQAEIDRQTDRQRETDKEIERQTEEDREREKNLHLFKYFEINGKLTFWYNAVIEAVSL